MTDEQKEYQRQYYLKHREEQLEIRRKYYQEHKEYFQQYRDNHKKCCVYLYKDKNTNEIVYIGSTNNINRRISKRKHFPCCQFDKLYKENPNNYELNIIQETETRKLAYKIERELTLKYKPKYNVYNKG